MLFLGIIITIGLVSLLLAYISVKKDMQKGKMEKSVKKELEKGRVIYYRDAV